MPETPSRGSGITLGAGGGGLGEDALVVAFVHRDNVVGAELFLGVDAGELAHGAAAIGAGEKVDSVFCGALHFTGFDEVTIDAVLYDLWHATDVGGDDRDFAGHGFERREAEGFQLRRK
jgi:hypothetical protein